MALPSGQIFRIYCTSVAVSVISALGMASLLDYSNNVLRESSLDAYNHLDDDHKVRQGVFTINDINKLKKANGYVIIDNILTKEQLKLIADQINNMNDRFTNNDNGDDKVRNDKIYWVGETYKDDKDDPLLHAIRILRSIPYELNMKQGVPMVCQLSCFDKGGKYIAHRDVPQVMDADYTLSNLLLHMLSIVNTREVTIVLYLNSLDWDSSNDTGNNNGNLRLYVDAHHNDTKGNTSTDIIDIPPKGGRIIIFNSSELLHEVLPSKNQRIALTLWIGGRSSRNSYIRSCIVKRM